MEGDLFRISHSKIRAFETCRKLYWFRYVSGLQWPRPAPTPAGVVGTAVHRAMKILCDTGVAEDGANELDTYLRMPAHECAGPGTEHYRIAFELFAKGCEAHDSIAAEKSWAELETWAPWPSRNLSLTARIDRVDRLAPDHYQVIDWKTGRYDFDDVIDFQLDIGQIAARVSRQLPEHVRVTAIGWNLRSGDQRVRELGRSQARATMERVAGIAERMQTTSEFEPTPGPLCRYCDWLPQCPEAAAATYDDSEGEELEERPEFELQGDFPG